MTGQNGALVIKKTALKTTCSAKSRHKRHGKRRHGNRKAVR